MAKYYANMPKGRGLDELGGAGLVLELSRYNPIQYVKHIIQVSGWPDMEGGGKVGCSCCDGLS
jgi:hypothetical protein